MWKEERGNGISRMKAEVVSVRYISCGSRFD